MPEKMIDDDPKAPDYWVDLRPTAAIAQIFTFIAMMIYIYTLVPQCVCVPVRASFFRQIAYILQMIRLFLLMAALLPCVLHSQVRAVMPELQGRDFAIGVILALIGNIIVSVGMRRFFECNYDTLLCLMQYLPFMGSVCSCCPSNNKCCPPPNCCPRSPCSRCSPNPCCPKPCCPKPCCPKPCCPKPCCPKPCCPKPCCPKPCCPKPSPCGCKKPQPPCCKKRTSFKDEQEPPPCPKKSCRPKSKKKCSMWSWFW